MAYSMYGYGPAIKAFRAKKNISQDQLAHILGHGQGKGHKMTVSRMEAGNLRPSRKEIEKMRLLFDLNSEEYTQLLLEAGWAPTDEEVNNAWKETGSDQTSIPVFLIDWRWFVRAWNTYADSIFGFSKIEKWKRQSQVQKQLDKHGDEDQKHPHLLEMYFLSNPKNVYIHRRKLEQVSSDFWEWHANNQVYMFRQQHPDHQAALKDKWYAELLVRLNTVESFSDMWLGNRKTQFPLHLLPSDIKYDLELGLSFSSSGYSLELLPTDDNGFTIWDVTCQESTLDVRLEWVLHFPRSRVSE